MAMFGSEWPHHITITTVMIGATEVGLGEDYLVGALPHYGLVEATGVFYAGEDEED